MTSRHPAVSCACPKCQSERRTTPPPATDEREAVAVALWVADAVRAAPNVARYRNAASFKEQDANHIELWLGQAGAALSALAPYRAAEILAAEARGHAMAVEDAANEATDLWEYGIPAQEFPRRIRAIERNEHGVGK